MTPRRLAWAVLVVALAVSLAWAIRGQHGHERGAAFVGAILGVALAAVTGQERWVWAAVWGSLGFAVGGAMSYGPFVGRAVEGSLGGLAAFMATGALWGALGAGALGWGLRGHSRPERWQVAGLVFLVWLLIDWPLSARLESGGLAARIVLLGVWAALVAGLFLYYRLREPVVSRLALAGALGWGIGFPLGLVWLSWGPATGWTFDWWKWVEQTIGFIGGGFVAWQALRLPRPVASTISPWQRWAAGSWCFVALPVWLCANNLVYWGWERRIVTAPAMGGLALLLAAAAATVLWVSARAVRAGRWCQRSWMAGELRLGCLLLIWLGTAVAILKMAWPHGWSSTQTVFVGYAAALTALLSLCRGESA